MSIKVADVQTAKVLILRALNIIIYKRLHGEAVTTPRSAKSRARRSIFGDLRPKIDNFRLFLVGFYRIWEFVGNAMTAFVLDVQECPLNVLFLKTLMFVGIYC
jgi:hypothetical protein